MAMDSSQQGATAFPLCQDQPTSELPEDSTENLPESSPTRMEDDGREEDVKENEDLSKRMVSEAQAINIDIAADIGLSLKASHDLLSAQAGGKECLGFTREDQKNYLRTRRQRSLKFGESGALLGYFCNQAAQNPYFYYAVQLDKEDMITNIFWADHEMITDYALFGDAISFDTTFRTNKEYRPFALFAGFNHFRMTCIFGAALLYGETAESFEWLFKTFLHAMSGKKPITIFTDKDAAMAKAIKSVLPDVSHGLCTFHLNQNALKHLGHLFNADQTLWDTIVLEKGYEESKAIFNSREKFQRTKLKESPILIQVSQVYSPPLFDLFHNEVDASLRCGVKPCLEFGGQFNFFISKYREKVKYVVKGSVETDEFGETIC
ncbi:hypothetical protein RHMOL_Rhmol12G0142900 [Rhododendron molle]|uniref:Uncharacterized protein n=1 Tax=Rhododendron molle TaxID=49168 RepID=A0ACC0LIZ8_RHOML|nr:hypothetical protein RHMOL_Rhmol12G0142900 [Rhododendron molle]